MVELAQVLDRIGLAFLRCEVAALAAEVCPFYGFARVALLEAGEGGTYPSIAGNPPWTPATLAAMGWDNAGTETTVAALHGVEALAALPDPFTAEERADFTARGWLLDPDRPAVAEALALASGPACRLGPVSRVVSPHLSPSDALLVLADAMAAALRRRGGDLAEGLDRRRLTFRARILNRMRFHAHNAPRRHRRNIARIFLRRYEADPEIVAAAEVEAGPMAAEAAELATERAAARRAHLADKAAEGRARLEAQRAAP